MTPTRFSELAGAYGGNIENWPIEIQEAARALLQQQPELRTILNTEGHLDDALAAWTVPEPGAALTARIITALAARQERTKRFWAWLSGLTVATVLAGGVAAGVLVVAMAPAPQEETVSPLYQLTVLGAPLGIDPQAAANGPAS